MSVLLGLLGLSLLIFFHELGHFIVAKKAGVKVNTFSLGFGPRIWGFKAGETDCRISAIPLGGYVRMVGENPDDEVEEEDIPRSFAHKPLKWRIAIVAAGPLANVVFALVVYFIVLLFWGVPSLTPKAGDIVKGEPAFKAGVLKGDLITDINGAKITTWGEMVSAIQNSQGKPLKVTVKRGGELKVLPLLHPQKVEITDMFGEKRLIYRVGIKASPEVMTLKVGLWESFGMAFKKTYMAGEIIVLSVVKMIQRKISMDNLGGPILIAQAAGQAASHSMASLLDLMALISVNLAILNLLPIPVLDGGHLLFFLIEAVRRKPVRLATRERAQQAGMAILLMFMAFVFYNDIARIFSDISQ